MPAPTPKPARNNAAPVPPIPTTPALTDANAPGVANAPGIGKRVERLLRRVDAVQQRSPSLGFVFGVIKKRGDDRGGLLAAQLAFSGFMSFFPLILVIVTVTSFLSERSPAIAERIRTSVLSEFPVVGSDLTSEAGHLPGSGIGLLVGFAGLVWGAFGFTQSLQYTFLEIWHVPHKNRPGFVFRMAHGLAVFALLGLAGAGSLTLGLLGTLIKNSRVVGAIGLLGAAAITAGLFFAMFWLLSPRNVRIVDLIPGAALATIGWQALQLAGIWLVGGQLRRSSELYGTIGATIGLIWFLQLFSQILIYALEVTVVRKDHLWPRSLLQPPLTGPDIAVLTSMALQEERRPEEHVRVDFEPTASSLCDPSGTGDRHRRDEVV